MPTIDATRCNHVDIAIRRFRRACEKSGVFGRLREVEYFRKPTTLRRLARITARKRHMKLVFRQRALLKQRK